MCSQWLHYALPLVSRATRADGQFSIDLIGGRVPLDDPTAGDVSGQLTVISAQITPGPFMEPFALVGQQLRNILSGQLPGLANSNPRPLVNIPPQTVNFRAVNRRVYHDRIEMTFGSTVLRTRGSVGLLDESLIMEAEVPVTNSLQPNAPPDIVRIPISGTLSNPKARSACD